MHVYQAIRTVAKRSGMSLIEVGPRLGHGKAYVSSMFTQERRPKYDTLLRILGACNYTLCAVPSDQVPSGAVVIDS